MVAMATFRRRGAIHDPPRVRDNHTQQTYCHFLLKNSLYNHTVGCGKTCKNNEISQNFH